MKFLRYAFTPAMAGAQEAPAVKEVPVRGPNAKMERVLQKVNGSSRFNVTSLEEQTAKALARRKA